MNVMVLAEGGFGGAECIGLAPWVVKLSQFPFVMLQLQMLVVFCVTQTLHHLIFKQLHLPPIVSQLYAGILLGPSGLGRNPVFREMIFPHLTTSVWKCITMLSYTFTLFTVSVKMDFGIIFKTEYIRGMLYGVDSLWYICCYCSPSDGEIPLQSHEHAGYQTRNISYCRPILRPDNIVAVTNLLNVSSPTTETPIVAYILYLMKLVGRFTSCLHFP